MANKCKVIMWDRNYQVRGIVVVQKGDNILTLASVNGSAGMPFSAQLREVNIELSKFRDDAIILSGFLPEYICFEIKTPSVDQRTLKDMLRFELPGQIPVSIEGMNLFFRQIKREGQPQKARVFAVRSKVWRDWMAQVKEAGVKFDAFCHPFMAVDLVPGESVAFPSIAPNLVFGSGEDGLASLQYSDENEENEADVEQVLCSYVVSKKFAADRSFLSELPEEFKLHRFKIAKRIACFLALLVLVSGVILLYRHWKEQDLKTDRYRRAIRQIEEQLMTQNAKIEQEYVLADFSDKMLDAINEVPVLSLLSILSEKLPSNVWITSFRAGNRQVAVTLSITGDTSSLNDVLLNILPWQLENLRQQEGADGAKVWYITLKRK